MMTKDQIRTICELWLDTGICTQDFEFHDQIEHSVNPMDKVGSFLLSDTKYGTYYHVAYQSLMSLHGSGADDINTVTSITTIV